MSCKELVELVTEYLDGSLSSLRRDEFEQHISVCSGCVEYVEQLRLTVRAVGGLRDESIPPDTREELLAAFRDWKRA